MKNSIIFNFLIWFVFFFSVAKMQAQVTIGADSLPHSYSVLELYSQYKTGIYGGLRLPQLTEAQRDLITGLNQFGSFGLMIYNLDINCVEFWNATKWVPLCGDDCETILDVTIEPKGKIVCLLTYTGEPLNGVDKIVFTEHDINGSTVEWYVDGILQTEENTSTFEYHFPTGGESTHLIYAISENICDEHVISNVDTVVVITLPPPEPCTSISGVSVTPATPASIATGTSTLLTATVTPLDATNVIYQWERSIDGGITFVAVPGATGTTFNAPAVMADVTQYRVVVSNSCTTPKTSNVVNITGTNGEVPPTGIDPYVGAFWKNNQRGERLIRVARNVSGTADGDWTATVLVGDWIVLDTVMTPDLSVGWRIGGNDNNTVDMMVDNNPLYWLPNNAGTTVSGTINQNNPQIYFRIGVTGTLPSGAAPRYGIVLLTYKNNTISQRIWIRQGEEADYLMRVKDASTNTAFTSSSRPSAVKFLPYNLQNASGATPTSITTNATPTYDVGLAVHGGALVQYPSQAGYYLLFNYNREAFSPYSPTGAITNWTNTLYGSEDQWNATHTETCPTGYRRPEDGNAATETNGSGQVVAGSEIRQSLWLNPPQGNGNPQLNNYANSIWGFYADGFFDRRKIVNSLNNTANCAVSTGNNDVAYIGRLFFNPNSDSYASLFFPAPGSRGVNAPVGGLSGTGTFGGYWTSTAFGTGTTTAVLLRVASGQTTTTANAGLTNFNRAQGISIRCVKE